MKKYNESPHEPSGINSPIAGQSGIAIGDASLRLGAAADDIGPLHEISTLLIREGEVAALYERVLDGAIRLLSAEMGTMQILDRQSGELTLIASRGLDPRSVAFWQRVRAGSNSTCGQSLASRERIVVRDVESYPIMKDTADLDACRSSEIRAVQTTPLISRSGPVLGMISTHWREPHTPLPRALRQLDVLARQAADLIERGHAEDQLRQSEERSRRLAEVVESIDDGIISTDLSAVISTWNKGAERIYGYRPEEIIGKLIRVLIPPDRLEEEAAILERIRKGERVEARDTVRMHKDGRPIDVLLSVSLLKNASGDVVGGCSVVRAIGDRKQLERDVQLLSRELDHRARNLLGVVQATVSLSNADTTQELKAVIGGRIRALSNAHTLLAERRWTGADLASLIRQELSPYCAPDILQDCVRGSDVHLSTAMAQPFALLFHELTTNAVKYGALSNPAGRVVVTWNKGADHLLSIHWLEGGGPPVVPPKRHGFGMRVIEEVTRRQLRAEMQLDWASGGLRCSIEVPNFSDPHHAD